MDRESLLIQAQGLNEKYLKLLAILGISMAIHFAIFIILQFIDYIAECFTFHEEVYMFYVLRHIFFALHLISIIAIIAINGLYIKADIENEKDKKEDEPKSNITMLSFIKLNITLFTIWAIILFGTSVPRIYLLMTNGGVIGGFTKVLIYLKMPFVIGLYLHAYAFYCIYKEITKFVEELGDEALK